MSRAQQARGVGGARADLSPATPHLPHRDLRSKSRCVGYLRVSTNEQAQRGLGLPVQEQAVIDYCRREGMELVGLYSDPGVPGTTALHEREGLAAALADVKAREDDPLPVTALVVPRWDRLARDTLQALLIEQEFERHGAPVVSADGLNGDQTMRELLHVMAGAERRALVARLAAGRRAKAAAGGYAGGRPLLGFKAHDGELVVDEEAAQVVRGIYMHVARNGWSVRRVARELDERRALGRRWDAARVHGVLKREDYKGAIVDPRIWHRAQRALASRRRNDGRAAAAA